MSENGALILSPKFDEAVAFAVELHREQPRKGTGVPYVSHLFSVAALVLEHGGTEEQAIAALLHDAVEDQGGKPTAEVIRARFGDSVADIVEGCTDTDVSPKPPWRERKEAYVARVRREPVHVRLVSAADKLHNARTMVTDLRIHGPALLEAVQRRPGRDSLVPRRPRRGVPRRPGRCRSSRSPRGPSPSWRSFPATGHV